MKHKYYVAELKRIAKILGGYYKERWIDGFIIGIPEKEYEIVHKNAERLKIKLIGIGVGFDYNARAYTEYVEL